MSLQSLLPVPKAVVTALAYYGPEIYEIIDCEEEFYSPTQVAVSMELSLEKVKAVFNRLLFVAQLFGVERSEEMRAYVVSFARTNFVCQHMLQEQPNRLPVNPDQLGGGSAYWRFQLLKVLDEDKTNNPTVTTLKALTAQVYKPAAGDHSAMVHFSPQELKPMEHPFGKGGQLYVCQLPNALLELTLEYAFMPSLKEMIKESGSSVPVPPPGRGYTYSANFSFNYPFLAENLSHLVKACDTIVSCFGIGSSLSKDFLRRIAQGTYHCMRGGPNPAYSNQDRVVKQECHWDMNLSIKVHQLIQAKQGCRDPAIIKIWSLFVRYGIQPKSRAVVEWGDPNKKKPKAMRPEENGKLLAELPTSQQWQD